MKIALCITGHLRSFPNTLPYLKRLLLDAYDTDVFLTSWKEPDARITDEALSAYKPVQHHIYDYSQYEGPFRKITDSVNALRIKRLEVTSLQDWAFDDVQPAPYPGYEQLPLDTRQHPIGIPVVSQFFQVQSCLRLVREYTERTGTHYDLVIRIRPDLLLFTQHSQYASTSFPDFAGRYRPEENKLELAPLPDGSLYSVVLRRINGTTYSMLNDYFYYGSQATMLQLCDLCDGYSEHLAYMKQQQLPVALQGVNESILYYFARRKGIRVVSHQTPGIPPLYSVILRNDDTLT
jgi:hypothetical protein